MTDKIMIIRHAEKQEDHPKKLDGVQEDGDKNEHELIVRGWQRAGGLAALFAPWSAPARSSQLLTPATIFATQPDQKSESKRPHHTVKPLAQRLNLTINLDYVEGDEAQVMAAAQAAPGPVLICWHHGHIPKLAAALKNVSPTPPAPWPEDRFDMIWVFDQIATGWSFTQVPQMLLAGDSATPF